MLCIIRIVSSGTVTFPPPKEQEPLICRLGCFADATVKKEKSGLALPILSAQNEEAKRYFCFRRDDDGVCGSAGSVGAKKVGRPIWGRWEDGGPGRKPE